MQVKVAIGATHVFELKTLNLNALDQTLVKSVKGIQNVNSIMMNAMRGRIVKTNKGMETLDTRLSSGTAHLLRLIQNDNGIIGCDYIDGATAGELISLGVHDTGLLGTPALLHGRIERLHVDDHDIDIGARREAVDITQVSAVVDKIADSLAVLLEKVLLGILERFIDALTNSDGRHHDDELGPTVKTVEFKHRLGIDIGLTGARFHFYIKVHGSRTRCQTCRFHNAITALNLI